jgi:general secretion pathway protein G
MKKNSKGFTLIELLIVVAIIGILSAILIPNLLSARERGRRANSEGNLKAVASASEQFAVDFSVYPATADVWGADVAGTGTEGLGTLDPGLQPYLGGDLPPTDGWNNDLAYAATGTQFQAAIASWGRGGAVGGTGFDTDIFACMPGGQVRIDNDIVGACGVAPTP